MIAPMTPHFSEELWERMGHNTSVFDSKMPSADPQYTSEETVELVVQINSKIRARVQIPADTGPDDMKQIALSNERVLELLAGKKPLKVIVIPNKLVNLVVK